MAASKLKFESGDTLFAELLEALPHGVILSNAAGEVLSFNGLALRLLDLDENALIEQTKLTRVREVDPYECLMIHGCLEPALRVLQGHRDFEHCVRTINSDGSSRLLTVNAKRVISSHGEARVMTTVRDSTDEATSHREREMQRILNSIPALVAYFDRNQINVSCNDAYAKFFGLTPKQVRGKSMRDLFDPVFYARNEVNVLGALAGRMMKFESSRAGIDGRTRHLLVTYTPDVVDGLVDGFQIVVTDISDLKEMEAQRRDIEAQLTTSSKMSLLGEMAGGIAHEINNPLSIIGGTAAILRASVAKGTMDAKNLDASLVKIETTVHRIAKIIRGLKIFARDAAKDPKMIVPIETIVGDTLELCHEKMKMRGIQVHTRGVKNISARCNPTQVSQILMNLLSNAIDAIETLPDKWIELSIEVEAERVKLFVADSGRGIPKDVAEKMLNPFFTTKPVGKGTGLGLSISKALAEENSGSLNYLSDRPSTCFVLELPLAVT